MTDNNLTTLKPTMTSLELAEISGKRHGNVIRDIEEILDNVGIDRLKFESGYKDANGQIRKLYSLPRDETLLVTSKWSDQQRWMIIKKFNSPPPSYKFIERQKLNVHRVTPGCFSVIQETFARLYSHLEVRGHDIPDCLQGVDISVGRAWAKHMRVQGIMPFRKYQHRYPDGRVVDAYEYPNELLGAFTDWIHGVYMKEGWPKYLKSKVKDGTLTHMGEQLLLEN